MRQIAAISSVFIRFLVRSRVVAILTMFILAICVLLPLLIEGDGTAGGWLRITISYNLGFSVFILLVASVWISCSAISQEITEKQIQLLVTKPVSAIKIWTGKWSAILVINACLLMIAGIATTAVIHIRLAHYKENAAKDPVLINEILTGRRLVAPTELDVDNEVKRRFLELKQRKLLPEDQDVTVFIEQLRKQVISERNVVTSGRKREWIFDIPKDIGNAKTVLRYKLKPSSRDLPRINGTWTVLTEDGNKVYEVTTNIIFEGRNVIDLPSGSFKDARRIRLQYSNSETSAAQTVIFDTGEAVALLISESSFEANLFRASIILFCITALITAIGVSAGSLFSMPVASFTVISLMIASFTSSFFVFAEIHNELIEDGHDHGMHSNIADKAGIRLIKAFQYVNEPATRYQTLEKLADGILITWQETGSAVLWLLLVYPGVMAGAASLVLRKRQLALPDKS